jgi:hypothetical protein
MATRATYTIEGMHFYCHWDGYPTGAAARMVKMIEAYTQPQSVAERAESNPIDDRRGGLAFAFIRGNHDAEPTDGPLAYGDTEWHYEVFTCRLSGVIRVKAYTVSDDDGMERFHLQSDDTLEAFCNHHGARWQLPLVVSIRVANGCGTLPPRYLPATESAARAIASLYRAAMRRLPPNSAAKNEVMKQFNAWDTAVAHHIPA